ncbi:MAG: tRNA (adenosine(37)-N6)-threonylcarbamoyltransferase complex dimerization subunit type 1 TsaB [Candidatus Margulisbacteria bacterium]|nr:tRNA (adenosine(37)-N6)-threonylcarbamoyltransferase complex dimerization subunit type 1 TsaB [Candidatus Margulisiibacteriota bacterium]
MRILGLSSATKIISIGLIDEEKVLAETTIADIQAEKIMFYVQEAGIRAEDIDGVAVAAGPGSYSGLRGGLATAKSLAQTLNKPLAGVPTLEAIAYNLINIEGTMAVILDARADEYNFALFGASGGKLKRLTDDLVMKLETIVERLSLISGEIWLAGNTLGIRDQGLGDRKNLRFAEEAHSQPYGINVAKLGLLKLAAGLAADPLALSPEYSHQPHFKEYH